MVQRDRLEATAHQSILKSIRWIAGQIILGSILVYQLTQWTFHLRQQVKECRNRGDQLHRFCQKRWGGG